MSHITTCGKLYEEFSEESASAPNKRECGACWMKRDDAEHEAREHAELFDFQLIGADVAVPLMSNAALNRTDKA